jgi:hypothetical protein
MIQCLGMNSMPGVESELVQELEEEPSLGPLSQRRQAGADHQVRVVQDRVEKSEAKTMYTRQCCGTGTGNGY